MIEQFEIHLRAAGASERTVTMYLIAVRDFAGTVDNITSQTVAEYQAQLAATLAAASVRAKMAAIRRYVEFLCARGCVVCVSWPSLPRTQTPIQNVALDKHVYSVLQCLNDRYRRAVLLMWHCGLRVGEVRSLTWDRVDMVERSIVVRRKGGKHQALPILSDALLEQLAAVPPHKRVGPVVPGQNGTAAAATTIARAIAAGCEKAGVPVFNCHALRHGFAHRAATNKVPVVYVQQMLGHTIVETTQSYLRGLCLGPDVLRQAFEGERPPHHV